MQEGEERLVGVEDTAFTPLVWSLADYIECEHDNTNLAVNFLDIVSYPELVTLRVHSNRAIGVSTHGDLVWLYKTHLTILIQDTEGVTLGLVDNADCLLTEHIVRCGFAQTGRSIATYSS